MSIRRVFVEKKEAFAVEARSLFADLRNNLLIKNLQGVRILARYDVAGLTAPEFKKALTLILSEPPVDKVTTTLKPAANEHVFAVELLPGQYDQREDFAAQCIQLITQKEKPLVSAAKVYVLKGKLTAKDIAKIKSYCINPVEAREAALDVPKTLEETLTEPGAVALMTGFLKMTKKQIAALQKELGLAMSVEDLLWCQGYFQKQHREPTLTEIRVLDTYWSDHCRHTTFMTCLEKVEIANDEFNAPVQTAFAKYMADRKLVYGSKTKRPITFMDMAGIITKKLKKEKLVNDLDQSEEINACSINVPVKVNGKSEKWLVMFKNETHNHPTEIEPFGGAATCLGGAIRDPLSGRSYVYQAMRITGAGDPRVPIEDTLPGKLPQRKLTLGAAAGYSAYGNQIGLATGYVHEYYHNRFVAKRMEVGGVIGAVPKKDVKRQRPLPGDIIVLLGGRTGRDGIGGATGSSKEHTVDSLATCGAEVQKGNPPTERKIQRLFRNPKVTMLIKRCNDFGAGGVSVAIGELAPGLAIDLDKVTKKYEGLDGTELAISESQERMAVVIAAKDWTKFKAAAAQENLEATVVAKVTAAPRLVMSWRGKTIVDIERAFLDTNGVAQHADVKIEKIKGVCAWDKVNPDVKRQKKLGQAWLENLSRLNVCSEKGLCERFDSTIGRGTVEMPFGGKYQLTPTEGMVGRIPVLHGTTSTATVMTCGYNPDVACWSPFHGAMYAVTESIVRAVALGADPAKLRFSLQEYFQKLVKPADWGQPLSALLGANTVLDAMQLPAIGGKDSMSGTFMDKHVPPTLLSFAVGVIDGDKAVSSEFKAPEDKVVFVSCPILEGGMLDFEVLRKNLQAIHKLMQHGKVYSAAAVKEGGIAATLTTMCFGNGLGFSFVKPFRDTNCLFTLQPGGILLEVDGSADLSKLFGDLEYLFLGTTTADGKITINSTTLDREELVSAYTKTLEPIFPSHTEKEVTPKDIDMPLFKSKLPLTAPMNFAKPKVFIPVFPGINCEYDSAQAFKTAGAAPHIFVVRNLTAQAVEESVAAMVKGINEAQIIMLPGGFSAGDEPDGSGKFIATMFRNKFIAEAVQNLLENRDGLILGICNGFQALIKLGLLPYGRIKPLTANSPTLTFNNIGRHVSQMVYTRVVSNKSPWLAGVEPGEIFTIPVSHGEGRFYAPETAIKKLFKAGQVATQYVDLNGKPVMDMPYNPNGSLYAVEGITSPDGRILGKMGHSERYVPGFFKNIYGFMDQKIFTSGVKYFK
jgi:phosphoribosylformylglycinamidine synthase